MVELELSASINPISGVYIRNQSGGRMGTDFGYEINIYDTDGSPTTVTGAIIRFSPPLVQVVSRRKWNKYEIKAEGTRIVVHLNGTLARTSMMIPTHPDQSLSRITVA